MNWVTVKESLHLWYGRVAQFYLFQSLILYTIGCMAAGHALGPAEYASFLHHLFLFR